MMLTGGEKYTTKKIIVKISELYPEIERITSNESYINSNSSLSSLYNHTLDILTSLVSLTTNIISSNKNINEIFTLLQEVHKYREVSSKNKQSLVEVVKRIPELQEELINLVESDTSNRDSVLRQIMDELGIVDPNAKKKHSLW